MSDLQVIFGTGPLAKSVMRGLIKRNKPIRMINRSGKRSNDIPDGVEILGGDAYDFEFTKKAARNAEVVFQCAQPAYHQWVEKFPHLQAAILEGAASNSAKLIVGENLYMYGDVNGAIQHEELPYAATTRKGKVRGEMSRKLMQAHLDGKVKVAIGRGSDFYGPGVLSSTLGERTIVPLLNGKPAEVTGSMNLPHTYTYIRDFGEALVSLSEKEEALGQVWHVPNPPTLTQRELLTLFFKEAALEPKFSVMGKTMLKLGGLFVPAAREMVEMYYEFEKPFRVDSSKFIQAFGDISTPHEVAIRETIHWYRDYLARV